MSKPYKAVIFDLGRVLVRLDLSSWTRHLFTGRNPKDIERTLQQIMKEDVVKRCLTGQTNGPSFHRELCGTYGIDLSYERFVEVWQDIFSPMPGMDELVEQVKQTHRAGLLSDTDLIHWQFLSVNYPVLRHFDKPTLSFLVGTTKPDPLIYQTAAANVGATCEECFYIDDLSKNVDGARQAGMTAVQFQNPDQVREDLKSAGIL